MTLELYTISGAPRPWRVLLGAHFKNLPLQQHILQASKGEHKSAPFLNINPRGTVPVLIDGEIIIRDSIGALAWLDQAYPDTPLFGNSVQESAKIWHTVTDLADYFRAAQHGVVAPIFFQKTTRASPNLKQAAKALAEEILKLDHLLIQNPFLCSTTPSAADAVAFPELRIIKRACDKHPDIMNKLGFGPTFETAPFIPLRVSKWVARIEALPNIHQTFPAHW